MSDKKRESRNEGCDVEMESVSGFQMILVSEVSELESMFTYTFCTHSQQPRGPSQTNLEYIYHRHVHPSPQTL